MAPPRVVLTYEDYAALPADGRRYEIHEGELSVTPSPGIPHQEVSANLGDVLRAHVRARGLGTVLYAPLDVILSDTTIVQPDLVYIDPGRRGMVTARGLEGAPEMVVEIIWPTSARLDRVTKLQLYAHHGVPYCWIVDPGARTIEVNELGAGGYCLVATARGARPVSLPRSPTSPSSPTPSGRPRPEGAGFTGGNGPRGPPHRRREGHPPDPVGATVAAFVRSPSAWRGPSVRTGAEPGQNARRPGPRVSSEAVCPAGR